MQSDGNLVLYEPDGMTPEWWSGTDGEGPSRAVMQSDGNFVVYRLAGGSTWATGTNGKI